MGADLFWNSYTIPPCRFYSRAGDIVNVIEGSFGARARQMEAYQYFISLVKRDECLQHGQATNPRSCSPVSRKCLPSSLPFASDWISNFNRFCTRDRSLEYLRSLSGPPSLSIQRNEIVINVAPRYTSTGWKFKTPAVGGQSKRNAFLIESFICSTNVTMISSREKEIDE